jgi:hypothetical protein
VASKKPEPYKLFAKNWRNLNLNFLFDPFTAEVAIMRLLGSAPKSHLCDPRRRSKVTGLSDLMTLFIDLGCLYCKQTQRAFNVFKNTLNWLKIDSVDQKFNSLECGNFSQDSGMPGTERVIAFSQLAVKGLRCNEPCAFIAGPLPPYVNTAQNAINKLAYISCTALKKLW